MSFFGQFLEYRLKASWQLIEGTLLNANCSSCYNERSRSIERNRRKCNISLLILLYIMQGIPLGIVAIIPYIIKENGGNFAHQAIFSLVGWPYALKMCWAPIVDSFYITSFGRRKTWLVTMQYLMGVLMMYMSIEVENLLNDSISDHQVTKLTLICFTMKFLVATQDIAVDGWALTMSKYSNCTYICDVLGIFIGFFIGYIVLPALESASFCNTYVRTDPQEEGLVRITSFLWFLGISYISVTTIIALFSEEENTVENVNTGIKGSYRIVARMLHAPAVQVFALILLTERVSYVPFEALNEFKLIEIGFTRAQISLLNVPIYMFQLILPFCLNFLIDISKPLDTHFQVMPVRIFLAVLGALSTFIAPCFMEKGRLSILNFMLYIFIGCLYRFCVCVMSTAKTIFFAHISDPSLGGTNLSFLYALNSLGGYWPNIISLWLVDKLSWKKCPSLDGCNIIIDGYYMELFYSTICGLIWLFFMKQCIAAVQMVPRSGWTVDFISSR